MSLFLVDASIWVSRLVPQDVGHRTVRRWMADRIQAGDELVSPSLLLPEVAGAISRRTSTALGLEALELLEDLPGLRLVEMDAVLVSAAGRLAAELGLRGADSIYVTVAQVLGLPLVTLDKDQFERAGRLVKVVAL